MPNFKAHLDYETSEHAGAGGMFQVITIEDENGKDYTRLVDHGTHYHDLAELKADIARKLRVTADEVDLEEV